MSGLIKSFFEALAKTLGDHAGKALWGLVVVGGPIVTWFNAPDVYTVRLTLTMQCCELNGKRRRQSSGRR
jgi:hypothetical protein